MMGANKVRRGCEQSTQEGANKVRTHNKYNSNNNNYTPPTATHARAKDFSEFSADSESAPPSPKPPSPAGGWMESLKHEIETNTDAWLLAMKRLGVKKDKAGLLEMVDEFDAHVKTDKREYQAETEYRRHFKSWAAKATEIQADKSEKASEKARKASPKKGINDATADMDRPQLF